MASIPDDLLSEILLRLPIKSLIRFQSVSKNWHSIITNPKFCQLRNQNLAIGLFSNHLDFIPLGVEKISTTPLLTSRTFAPEPEGVKFLHSCNGLLLLCNNKDTLSIQRRYYVCNPTTKKFLRLPKLIHRKRKRNSKAVCGMYLAFDPVKSPHYSVVCVKELKRGKPFKTIQTYSSESAGPWRVCGEPFTANDIDFRKGVYWNGGVHWLNYGIGDFLYFDIEGNVLCKMPKPAIPNGQGSRSNLYFGESCDHLYSIDFYRTMRIGFDVYEMKRDRSEWFLKYKVDLSAMVDANIGIHREQFDPTSRTYYRMFCVLLVVGGGEMEDSFLVLQTPKGTVIKYNLVTESFQVLHQYYFQDRIGFQYIESLCRVD